MYKKRITPKRITPKGYFSRDKSGLWHYTYTWVGSVEFAAQDALANKPTRAAWFWFMGTPAPIFKGDCVNDLCKRWQEWRDAYTSQSDSPAAFMDKIHAIASSN